MSHDPSSPTAYTNASPSSRTVTPLGGSLAVVIPVYNSENTIAPLIDELMTILDRQFDRLEFILVNDGSHDQSHDVVTGIFDKYPNNVKYLRLAKNFGEHNAVMCGLRHVTADVAVIIDDDFQNPPEEILKLISKLREGYGVVYSAYETKHHSWFRNLGSRFNDAAATRILKKPKNLYLSSFKAIDRFVIDAVVLYTGPYPYIDGLILRSTDSVGTTICKHAPRQVGTSNYTMRRLLRLWLNMFTSFSILPLRIASFLGLAMSTVGFALAVLFIVTRLTGRVFLAHELPPGWASTIVSITIFSGVQLCMLGIIGEYIGRLFLTQNRQPQFIIRDQFGTSTDPKDPHV